MTRALRFTADYEEQVVLSDGTRVYLRLVQPADKVLIERGFDRMSEQSRYRRFFTGKSHLTDRDLRYLTELDGENHFAIGAVYRDELEREEGLGTGRFVRCAEDPRIAEPAVAVIDSFQHRGLGRLLCRRIGEAAAERGVQRFRCEVLLANDPMRAILGELAPNAVVQLHGDSATIEFPLNAWAPQLTSDAAPSSMLDYLLNLAARGYLTLRRAVSF